MIQTVAVIGQGIMGSGIAQHVAACGYDVIMWGRNPDHVQIAMDKIRKSLARRVAKGKLDEAAMEATMAHIHPTSDLADTAGADLYIEAISEEPELKQEYFVKLEALARPDSIIASNTSSISITKLASVMKDPTRFIGMHFFNPVGAMKLVELTLGKETTEATYEASKAFCDEIKKVSVKICKDSPGFIVNRVLFAYFLECIRLYEEGVASIEDIDLAIKYGLNYPVSPFVMMDTGGGLDTFPHVCESLQEIDEVRFKCPESILERTRAGKLGQKTGEGWYVYNKE